jgi:predicted nucleic acid-binding protein
VSSLYVETSAILTWLLGQKRADEVRATVDAAEVVVTSSLTFTETERAVVRAEHERLIRAADGQRLRGILRRASSGWMRMMVTEDVLARAGRPFPVEPLRTLDAIHLATALAFTSGFSDLRLLSLDRRILDNARALGIDC